MIEEKPDIYGGIAESIKSELSRLQSLYDAHVSESRTWFRYSSLGAGLGLLIIFGGAIAGLTGIAPQGMIASVAGVIPAAVSGLCYQQKRSSEKLITIDLKRISDLKGEERRIQWVMRSDDKELIHDFARKYVELSNEK
jgi:hypothetical protein